MSWQDHATVTVQIGSVSGSPYAATAGWWQPDIHAPKNWMAAGAVPTDPGYGVWIADVTTDPSQNWDTIPWFDVHCDQMAIDTSAGLSPYEWNANSGSLTVSLYDDAILYTPYGPPGDLDDIGIDTPIRIKVEFTSMGTAFTQVLWAGFIRSISHAISVGGLHTTTIRASDIIEMYGRTNPLALTTNAPIELLTQRVARIHGRADRPYMFPAPLIPSGETWYLQADDLSENVWSEMCLAINSGALMATVTIYGRTPRLTATSVAVPTSGGFYDQMRRLTISRNCTRPEGPANVTEPVSVSPTSMSLNHSLDGLANVVSIAVADGPPGSAATASDSASITAYGEHSYTRHDLKIINGHTPPYEPMVADRVLARLADGTYRLDALTFPISTVRDLAVLVGQRDLGIPTGGGYFLMQPGLWLTLAWDEPTVNGRLMVTGVEHHLTADSWECTLSGELHQVTTSAVTRLKEAA